MVKKQDERYGASENKSKKNIKETAQARRERLKSALIDAAEAAMARDGLNGLKARELASAIGVATGQIYNLVNDLNELFFCVAYRVLIGLDEILQRSCEDVDREGAAGDTVAGATKRLIAIAQAYHHYASAHRKTWQAMFQHDGGVEAPTPDWFANFQANLLRHILLPLAILTPGANEGQRRLMAQTLFSATHGIVMLGLDNRLIATPEHLINSQLENFITIFTIGMRSKNQE